MSEKGKHELRIKAKRDWSMLNSQIVGSEVLPTANWEKIETLKKENATLQAQNERLVKALKKLLSDLGSRYYESAQEAKAVLEEVNSTTRIANSGKGIKTE